MWVEEAGATPGWPDLEADARCDVLVIGAGITGALAAWRLARAGLDTLVLDRREVGLGSTAASTALIQYEIDMPLVELRRKVGRPRADRAYHLCVEAFGSLEAVLEELGHDCGYARRESLYLATLRSEMSGLQAECAARRELGIDVELLERTDLVDRFGIDRPGALRSARGAELDAYQMTLRLAESATAAGARIRTGSASAVAALESSGTGVTARTSSGHVVRARNAIIATGYEFAPFLPEDLATLGSTFVVATLPLKETPALPGQVLIWETSRPYLYVRSTPDGRVMIGGEDEPFADASKRDALIDSKAARLIARAEALLPGRAFTPDCAWAGTFAETPDGLPYVGRVPHLPGVFASLAYGGNGITFGLIASEILAALCRGEHHPDARLFAFDR